MATSEVLLLCAFEHLCGVLQDYEMALSTLRLLSSDLKTDKKWRQYAGAQVKRPLSGTFVLILAGITLRSP